MPGISALIDAFAWVLLHFVWQGLLVGLAYGLSRRLMPQASTRLVLGHIALLSMAVLPLLTLWSLIQSPASLAPAGAAAVGGTSTADLPSAAAGSFGPHWLDWVVAIWAAGVTLLGARATGRWLALRRLCRQASFAPASLQRAAASIATQMGVLAPVGLKLAGSLATPIVIGCWRPVILLPMALTLSMPMRQLELLIAHELAHVKRWDYLANLLQSALEIVLFYHPAVHWVSAKVREDREHCCDDLVGECFGSRLTYARALLAVAEAQHVPAPHLAVAASGGILMPRIERILGMDEAPDRPGRDRIGALAVALALALAALTLMTRSDERLLPLPSGLPQALIAPASLPLSQFSMVSLPMFSAAPALPEFADEQSAPDGEAPALDRPRVETFESQAVQRELPLPEREVASASMVPQDLAPALPPLEPANAAEPDSLPRLVQYQTPEYPRSAIVRGIEGEVVLSFRIAADGRPVDIDVLSVDPPREASFVLAARTALQGWRFEAATEEQGRVRRAFEFKLADTDESHRCKVHTGSRLCRRSE